MTALPSDERRAVLAHPSLQRTLRAALETTVRDLPEFDANLRRLLIARYRAAEGAVAPTPGWGAKSRVLGHEAMFRSTLPRIVAACLNAEILRLGGHPTPAPRPEEGPAARVAAIAGLARGVPAAPLDELHRRIVQQLGRAPLGATANPLRPSVFLHAIGVCWRAVAGDDRDELDVVMGYGALWLPVLHRALPPLVDSLPPVPTGTGSSDPAAAPPATALPAAALPAAADATPALAAPSVVA